MAIKCKECGAFMECKYNGHVRSFWQCLNCKREISVEYKDYQDIQKKEEDEFL